MTAGKKNPEKKSTGKPGSERALRDDAEKQFVHSTESSPDLTGQSPEKLVHELGVHQIELAMQTEKLREAQFALEESRDKYLDLYEFAPVGYLTFTDKARITAVNLTGATLLGVERSRLVNHGLGRFIAPRDHEVWDQYFMKVQQQGEKQSCTLTLKRGDGTLFPARMDGIRISGRDGEITIRIAISDITDIWQIAALRDSEEKYRVIFNNEFYAICIFDLDTLKLLNVNDAYTKMYGYTRKELLSGMTIHDISAEHNATDSATEKAKDEGTIFIPLRYHRKKDGTIFPVEIVGGPYEWKGKQVMFALSHDITERKRVEDALALASRKLTLLSSITRHDINNQLTALLGYISLLEKKQSALAFKEYFPKIDGVVKRISTIFQFTREYEKIGIHAPLWQNCRILVNTAGKEVPLGQIILKNDLPASAEIFADPLIARVFYNLMDNAVLYGGKITTIRFSACDHERERIIVCENDGVSVPAEEKEKIFERGFGKNTGMGLFLSREILSITGITIRESGEAGKGVRFEMTVPKGAWRMTGEGD